MKNKKLTSKEWFERIVLALLFIVAGGAVIIILKPWGPLFFVDRFGTHLGKSIDYLSRAGAGILFLLLAIFLRRSKRFNGYWQVAYGMFILVVALTLSLVSGRYLFGTLQLKDTVPSGWAIPKVVETILIVMAVVLFTRLSGGSLGSIYIQKGKLKLGLIIGITTFLLAAAGSIPMASLMFKADGLTIARVVPWIPWVLVTVLANGTLEEVLFRGLFLRKLDPFFGKFLSNFLIAFVFTFLHLGSAYTSEQRLFLVVVFPLALLWGYIMQKSEGVWASILFHAGMDIPIFLGIFSTL